jgi:prophage DNA circulation protein
MASWTDRTLRPASLRGVPFFVDAGTADQGRRIVTHEFPGRDEPLHEDLGLGAATFTVEGLVVGDDCLDQLDAVEGAALAPGVARLVHPWRGALDVVVTGIRAAQSRGEGRVCRFTITVQRAGGPAQPGTSIDGRLRTAAAADALGEAAAGDWAASAAGLADAAGFVLEGAQGAVGRAGSLLGGALRAQGLVRALRDGDLAAALSGLATLAPDALRDPLTIGRQVAGLFRLASGLAGGRAAPRRSLPGRAAPTILPASPIAEALLAVAAAPPLPTPAPSTPSRATEASAIAAADRLIRAAAAGEAARAAVEATPESRDEAVRLRDRLADALDAAADRAGAAGEDATWRAATDLRAASVADLSSRSASLPALRRVELARTRPSVLVAYGLDGDDLPGLVARADDVALRNRARHPGFVTGGRSIEVLR